MTQTMNPAVAHVLKRLHYPLDVILMCVRWYVAYPLSLRHLEEMVAERGIAVDHAPKGSPLGGFDRTPLGNQAVANTGEGIFPAQAARRKKLVNGRDVHQGQGRVEVSQPRG
jgi:hypothetical protein